MRIKQTAPLSKATPPKPYGGTKRVVAKLTEELATLDHDVTLFASGDPVTSTHTEPMWVKALRLKGPERS